MEKATGNKMGAKKARVAAVAVHLGTGGGQRDEGLRPEWYDRAPDQLKMKWGSTGAVRTAYIDCGENKVKVTRCLIDTGATHDVMHKGVADKIGELNGIKMKRCEPGVTVVDAGGNSPRVARTDRVHQGWVPGDDEEWTGAGDTARVHSCEQVGGRS